jgi:hypothetical protein
MCPMCDCEQMAWAAPLGRAWHACCRACGWVFEFEPDDMEVSDVGSENTEGVSGDV